VLKEGADAAIALKNTIKTRINASKTALLKVNKSSLALNFFFAFFAIFIRCHLHCLLIII